MSDEYATFDCLAWLAPMETRLSNPMVCAFRDGSSIVTLELDSAVAAAALADPAQIGIPTLLSVTDPTTGESATPSPPGGLSLPIIIAIVIGVLLLVALIILIILCCARKKESDRPRPRSRASEVYVPLDERRVDFDSFDSSFDGGAAAVARKPSAARSDGRIKSGLVSCRMLHAVQDTADTVLPAREGDIAFATPEDYAETGEWVWVKIGTREGYVPRSYLIKMN